MKSRKNPSLPHIISTGLVLICLSLHQSWELATEREKSAVVLFAVSEARVAMQWAASLPIIGGMSGEMK
jgi:hypothetical protein